MKLIALEKAGRRSSGANGDHGKIAHALVVEAGSREMDVDGSSDRAVCGAKPSGLGSWSSHQSASVTCPKYLNSGSWQRRKTLFQPWSTTAKEQMSYKKLFEVDIDAVLKDRFEAGEGVIQLHPDTSEAVLLLAIKQASQFGKPFLVIPPAKL